MPLKNEFRLFTESFGGRIQLADGSWVALEAGDITGAFTRGDGVWHDIHELPGFANDDSGAASGS